MATVEHLDAHDPAADTPRVWSTIAGRAAERAAVRSGDGSVTTYGELMDRAHRTAGALHSAGVGREHLVGVCLDLGTDLVVAALAALRSGAGYLPLDPSQPDHRLSAVIADAEPSVVLTDQAHAPRLRALGVGTIVLPVGETEPPPAVRIGPHDTAYVVYTSGSTGTPKGVINSYEGLDEVLRWMAEDFPLHPGSRVLLRSTPTFDMSILELFWPLAAGATLIVPGPDALRDTEQLAHTLARTGVTDMFLVPSLLTGLLAEPALAECRSLRRILMLGEPFAPEQLRRLNEVLPQAEVANTYGPSEAAVVTLWHRCTRADAYAPRVPIGRPAGRTTVSVVRPGTLDAVAPGEPGELILGGPQLASGYHRLPGPTAEKFVDSPAGKLYRTGDIVVERGDGGIEFLGRADRQVKVRGCRVELGDVEAAALAAPFVRAAVAEARPHPQDGSTTLVAWVVADENTDTRRFRDHMSDRVPAYMVPDVVALLPAMPLLLNGKVDRSALPDPFAAASRAAAGPARPTSPLRLVQDLWAELSGNHPEHPDEAFLDSGGNSLLLLRFRSRLRSRGYPALRVIDLLEHPTPCRLAEFLASQRAVSPDGER